MTIFPDWSCPVSIVLGRARHAAARPDDLRARRRARMLHGGLMAPADGTPGEVLEYQCRFNPNNNNNNIK